MTAHVAEKPKTKESSKVAVAYAAVLAIVAVLQLFTFEKFPDAIASLWLPGGNSFAYFLAAFIVVAEVFALPFLLRLKLSHAMRWVSMLFGWLVPLIWLSIAIWLISSVHNVTNAGLFGATVPVEPGWWMVFVSTTLGIMAIWASWGLWPKVHTLRK